MKFPNREQINELLEKATTINVGLEFNESLIRIDKRCQQTSCQYPLHLVCIARILHEPTSAVCLAPGQY